MGEREKNADVNIFNVKMTRGSRELSERCECLGRMMRIKLEKHVIGLEGGNSKGESVVQMSIRIFNIFSSDSDNIMLSGLKQF